MRVPYGGRSLPAVRATVAALACATALSGCGSNDPTPSATPTRSAATPSVPSGSRTPSGGPTDTAPPSSSTSSAAPADLDPAQAADLVAGAFDDTMGARVVLDNTLGLLGAEGVADFRDTPAAVAATLSSTETGDEQEVELRVVDDVLYVADAKRWLSVDVDSASNPFGRSISDQLDPRTVLDTVFDQLSSPVRRTGSALSDDDEPVTTYRLTADGPGVAAVLAPELAEQPEVALPATVSCSLAVDDEGLARSIVVDLGESGQLFYGISDWGTGPGVTVTAPPAGQVDDLPALPGS